MSVAIAADPRTYWDNNGIIDEALRVIFVRTDGPGMLGIATVPRDAHMLPNTPLRGRPSDEELDHDTARIMEKLDYDLLAHGRTHDGSADYVAIATFSDAWYGPVKVRLTDPTGPKVTNSFDLEPKNASPWDEPAPSRRGVVARLAWVDGHVAVVGGYRVATGTDDPAPFLSLLIVQLRPTGGVVNGQLWLPFTEEKGDWFGSFKVVVHELRSASGPDLEPGNYALFAFVGSEGAPVQVFKVE